jgi:hypothetical protein
MGSFWFQGKSRAAHVVSYILHKRQLSYFCVCHSCDNSLCINPNHLFLGTQVDNLNDMRIKGRGVSLPGEGCGMSILKNETILTIRKEFSEGKSKHDLAKQNKTSWTNIHKIVTRKTWKHL